jgi:hypothetical protein
MFFLATRTGTETTTLWMRIKLLLQPQPEGCLATAKLLETDSDAGRDVQFAIAQFFQIGLTDPQREAGFFRTQAEGSDFIGNDQAGMEDVGGLLVVLKDFHGCTFRAERGCSNLASVLRFVASVVIDNLEQVDDVAIRVFVNLETQAVLLVQSNAELSGAVAAELLGL